MTDVAERDELAARNYRLAFYYVAKYIRHDWWEDALQAAYTGLLEAARRFDPGRGCRFSTYAMMWIKKEVFEFFYREHFMIRVPYYMFLQMQRDHDKGNATIKERQAQHAQTCIQHGLDGDSFDVPDSPEEDDCMGCLRDAIGSLDAKHSRVITEYYGLEGRPKTAREIAHRMHRSERTVQRLINEALGCLRGKFIDQGEENVDALA